MKNLLTLFVFCLSFAAISQEVTRENINGKIVVEGNDIEGITIYNASSEVGTISNENGEFVIAVALNDVINVRAVEYQNFDVIINEAIIESKEMRIFLIEEINKLEEVIVTAKTLTGDLKTDIKRVNTFSPKLNAVYFGTRDHVNNLGIDNKSAITNVGIDRQGQNMVNGLNVVNVVDQLLIPLFRSEVKDKKAVGVPEVPATAIKYYLGSTFLVENFNIPEHRVEEFIRYVEDETFDFDMLNYGHEMEFLEQLNAKSKEFMGE